jgi:hypothetical protein
MVINMPDMYIISGMMCSGKTPLAKILEKAGYHYINFDDIYHSECQGLVGHDIVFGKFLNRLKETVIRDWGYVIDGWFTWHYHWWGDNTDLTLEIMQETFPHHRIKLVFLTTDKETILNHYGNKHREDPKIVNMIKKYRAEYGERLTNLLKKIGYFGGLR